MEMRRLIKLNNTYLRIKIFIIVSFLIGIAACDNDYPVLPSDNLTKVPVLDVSMHKKDLDLLLANRLINLEISCNLYYKDKLYSAIIRPSGAGARFIPKWSYKIKLDGEETIEGLNYFVLSSQDRDKTLANTHLALAMYRQNGGLLSAYESGFPTFTCKHIFLRINNSEIGLYPMFEVVDENFFEKRNINYFELFKAGIGSRVTYEIDNYPERHFSKKLPEDDNFNSLKSLIIARDTCNPENIRESFGEYLDIDNYIRYHAITSLLDNYDAFTNNYYLFKPVSNGPFKIIPWDFDRCFDNVNKTGLYGKNDIITKLFENQEFVDLYKDEIKYQLEHFFREDKLFPIIDSIADCISEAYKLDPYLGLEGAYILSEETSELKKKISDRIIFFRENIDSLSVIK